MTLTYKQFPTGAVLLDIGTFILPKKTKEGPWTAPSSLSIGGKNYVFLFWDAIASPYPDANLTFTTPNEDSRFAVDAWYEETNGNGGSVVSTTAFSLNQHGVFPNTPIASVKDGSGAWTGPPSTTVDTTKSANPVVITALDKITGYGLFNS